MAGEATTEDTQPLPEELLGKEEGKESLGFSVSAPSPYVFCGRVCLVGLRREPADPGAREPQPAGVGPPATQSTAGERRGPRPLGTVSHPYPKLKNGPLKIHSPRNPQNLEYYLI